MTRPNCWGVVWQFNETVNGNCLACPNGSRVCDSPALLQPHGFHCWLPAGLRREEEGDSLIIEHVYCRGATTDQVLVQSKTSPCSGLAQGTAIMNHPRGTLWELRIMERVRLDGWWCQVGSPRHPASSMACQSGGTPKAGMTKVA